MGVRDADFYQTISNAPFSKSCPNGVEEADAKRKSGWWKKSENFPTPGLRARPGRRNTQEGPGATPRSEELIKGSGAAEDDGQVVGGHLGYVVQNQAILFSGVHNSFQVAHAPFRILPS